MDGWDRQQKRFLSTGEPGPTHNSRLCEMRTNPLQGWPSASTCCTLRPVHNHWHRTRVPHMWFDKRGAETHKTRRSPSEVSPVSVAQVHHRPPTTTTNNREGRVVATPAFLHQKSFLMCELWSRTPSTTHSADRIGHMSAWYPHT